MSPPALRTSSGFTLVEVITTVSLITLIAGIALPRIDFQRAKVRAAAHELVSTLTAAQSRAVLNQHDVVVRFDTLASTSFVHLDADNDGSIDAGESTVLLALPDGVRFGSAGAPALMFGARAATFTQLRDGLPSLTFHRNGSASQAGVIYLVAGPRDGAEDTHIRAIDVSRPTGRSACNSLRAGAWEVIC